MKLFFVWLPIASFLLLFLDIEQLKIIFQVLGKPTDLDWIKTPEAKQWVSRMVAYPGKDLSQVFNMATPYGNHKKSLFFFFENKIKFKHFFVLLN